MNFRYVVKVSDNALKTIILNGIESYSVENALFKKIKKGDPLKLEISGHLFGTVNPPPYGGDQVVYGIDFVNIDTTSLQGHASVSDFEGAMGLKLDIMNAYWPELRGLGSFHTHPYASLSEARMIKGYYISSGDRESMKHYHDEVALVLTIAQLGHTCDNGIEYLKGHTNCLEFTIGNLRLWLTAYAVEEEIMDDDDDEEGNTTYSVSEDNDKNVILDCPALRGIYWEHSDIGRVDKTGRWRSKC